MHISSPFQEAFDFGLMITTKLWFYEPSKLRYTFGVWDKSFICENFFSFHPNILGHAITFGSSFQKYFYIFNLSFRIRWTQGIWL